MELQEFIGNTHLKVITRARDMNLDIVCTDIDTYPLMGLVSMLFEARGKTSVGAVMQRAPDLIIAGRSAVMGVPSRMFKTERGVVLEVPYQTCKPLMLSKVLHGARGSRLVLGADAEGNPLSVDLSDSSSPHVFIAGTTGAGKTALMHSMMLSLTYAHPKVKALWIDPKPMPRPWLTPVAGALVYKQITDLDEAIMALSVIAASMDGGVYDGELIVFVDEVADLIERGGEEVKTYLRRIAARGREHHLHLVLATQKPLMKVVDFASNIPARVALKVLNATDSKTATGLDGVGAELLPKGQGFYVVGGRVTRFIAAIPDDYGKEGDGLESLRNWPEQLTLETLGIKSETLAIASALASGVGREEKIVALSDAGSLSELTVPPPAVTKRPEDYTLQERVKLLRAWNPKLSMTLAQKALAPQGAAGGFYAIQEAWGDE